MSAINNYLQGVSQEALEEQLDLLEREVFDSIEARIYPAPTSDYLDLNEPIGSTKWLVVNSIGQIIEEGQGSTVGVVNCLNGAYFIQSEEGDWLGKFFKK